MSYRTHDLRRGHAKVARFALIACANVGGTCVVQDLQKSRAPLAKIRAMGQWSANGMVPYLDECELEQDMALEVAIQSEDEEWID